MTEPASPDDDVAVGSIFANVGDGKFLTGIARVLDFDETRTEVFLIDLPQKSLTHPSRKRSYVTAPYRKRVSHLMAAKLCGQIGQIQVKEVKTKPDKDRLDATTGKKKEKLLQYFKKRDQRYDAIAPLIMSEDKIAYRLSILLTDKGLPSRIASRAAELHVALSTMYSWMHKYWAGGSKKDALLDDYSQCGNPGIEKRQDNKLGCSNERYKAGLTQTRGAPLKGDRDIQFKDSDSKLSQLSRSPDSDKAKLAMGWRLIASGVTVEDAFLAVSSVYWAKHEALPDGRIRAILYPQDERPTIAQFRRWGEILNDHASVTERILGSSKWKQKTETRGGSVQDTVTSVGQTAVFDSTSTDTYLTSIASRLIKLPPMTRSLLKERRSTVIFGWYCGWDSPSPRTAVQAILCGASPKAPLFKRFGIDIAEDRVPSILCRANHADNGEMKAQEITEIEEQFGFAVLYTRVRRGDDKGDIESQHRVDHQQLDEKLPGATFGGKHLDRGEQHASETALFNYFEYMREFLKHVLAYNDEEVPDLAPLDMPEDIPPTRLNIFNWLRARNSAELSCDVDELRPFALPCFDAVVKKNGVAVYGTVGGRRMLLPRLRYSSDAPEFLKILSMVKRNGHTLSAHLRMDPEDLTKAWLVAEPKSIPLRWVERGSSAVKQTLCDWALRIHRRMLDRDTRRGAREQAKVDSLWERRDTEATAQREQDAEIAELGKKPSKKDHRKNLSENVRSEQALLQGAKSRDASSAGSTAEPRPSPVDDDDFDESAARAMRLHHEQQEAQRAAGKANIGGA